MDRSVKRWRNRIILLSPFGVILLGHGTARLAGIVWGVWAWVPVVLIFWGVLAILIGWGKGWRYVRQWVRHPEGAWRWFILAMVVGLIPLPVFLSSRYLLSSWSIVGLWIVFALVNPLIEEGYWRGLLLDAADRWPGWLSLLYTSSAFALSHPFIWGVNSVANRTSEVIISTFLMGLAWGAIYRKTDSLRWTIYSHILVDLFNLSIPVFLNLYVPPTFRN